MDRNVRSAGADRVSPLLLGAGLVASLAVLASIVNPMLPMPAGGWLRFAVDLLAHQLWLSLPVVLGGALLAWHRRRRVGCAMMLAVAAAGSAQLVATATVPAYAVAAGPTLVLASANVHAGNTDSAALERWLAVTAPDVVALQEVPDDWFVRLERVPDYPHRLLLPRPGPDGMAVLSRWPIGATEVQQDAIGPPFLRVWLRWQGRAVDVTSIHPYPPVTPDWLRAQTTRLQAAAQAARSGGHPAVVLGDFNATPWSAGYAVLRRAGFSAAPGVAPTWPEWVGPAWLPLDHVFVSPHWQVVSAERGPGIGSDHFPVRVALRLRPVP